MILVGGLEVVGLNHEPHEKGGSGFEEKCFPELPKRFTTQMGMGDVRCPCPGPKTSPLLVNKAPFPHRGGGGI